MYRILADADEVRERRNRLRHPQYKKPELLATLGVTKSHSRPHVSNDNPFSESQFKTLKYRPGFPDRFGSQQDAQTFCESFFPWYNHEHYHSGIGMLTPAMVHYGSAQKVLLQRQEVLDAAHAAHVERFVNGRPSPGQLPRQVWINPPTERSEQHEPAERTNQPLIETQPDFLICATESVLDISLLTSANDLGRLPGPADLASSLNKTFTQINTNREEATGTSASSFAKC